MEDWQSLFTSSLCTCNYEVSGSQYCFTIAIQIAPSLLACKDWLTFPNVLKRIKDAPAIHIDVMDGNFVPNIAFGPDLTRSIKAHTDIPLDCHLMINCLDMLLPRYIEIKPRSIFIHTEATATPLHYLKTIRENDIIPGIAINPDTPFQMIEPWLPHVEKVLIMTVYPGFSGQEMIEDALTKIPNIKKMKPAIECWVDGGVTHQNLELLEKFGADGAVMGSAFFKND